MNELMELHELTDQQRTSVSELRQTVGAITAMMLQMQGELTALKLEVSGATILHQDALQLMRQCRARADSESARYRLSEPGRKYMRKEIKRQLLKRFGVRNEHDIPKARLTDAVMWVDGWKSIEAVMKAREQK